MAKIVTEKEIKDAMLEDEHQNPPPPADKDKPIPPPAGGGAPPAPPPVDDTISDDDFMKIAAKKGFKIAKEELTDEQKQQVANIEKIDRLKFAVENNLITPERYDALESIVNMDADELTKKEFVTEFKKENPKATAQEAENAYSDYYWVQRTTKVKETKEVDGQEQEVEVDKPVYDERTVQWGQHRRQTKAQRIKDNAKEILANIDTAFKTSIENKKRVDQYAATVDSVVGSIDFKKYATKYRVGKEEVEGVVSFDDKVANDVRDYLLDGRIVGLVIGSNKQTDASEVKKLVDGYMRSSHESTLNEKLWELAASKGRNEGKIGGSAPVGEGIIISNENVDEIRDTVNQLRPNLEQELPPESMTNRKTKNP